MRGFCDSWRLVRPLNYVMHSPGVLTRICQCMLINGALFLGSLIIFNCIILSFLKKITGNEYVETTFGLLFNLLWLYPVYVMSFVLTTLWVQDIFDASFKHFYGNKYRPLQALSLPQLISYLLNRIIMIGFFQIQSSLFSLLPFPFGKLLFFIHCSLLHSYYCFEYITAALNMRLKTTIEIFEYNWAYFIGFGLSFTMIILKWPGMISSGIFCFLFPFLVLTSVPAEINLNKRRGIRLPIFTVSLYLTNKLFKLIC